MALPNNSEPVYAPINLAPNEVEPSNEQERDITELTDAELLFASANPNLDDTQIAIIALEMNERMVRELLRQRNALIEVIRHAHAFIDGLEESSFHTTDIGQLLRTTLNIYEGRDADTP